MTIYIALLRGINVSGKNMIRMTELKKLFEELGCGRVQTYINSGNVLFESEERVESLQERIEQGILATFGLAIPVVLRTAEDLERIVAESPFAADVAPNGKNVNVGLLQEVPTQEGIDRLEMYKKLDDFQVVGQEIHLLFRQSVADSKLANNVAKIGVPVTVRNWNTMNKLVELAMAMKG